MKKFNAFLLLCFLLSFALSKVTYAQEGTTKLKIETVKEEANEISKYINERGNYSIKTLRDGTIFFVYKDTGTSIVNETENFKNTFKLILYALVILFVAVISVKIFSVILKATIYKLQDLKVKRIEAENDFALEITPINLAQRLNHVNYNSNYFNEKTEHSTLIRAVVNQ